MTIVPNPAKIRAFATTKAFETWLARHHDQESELYLRLYKKGSGVKTVSYAEALDVALCWGWIDGLKKSYDAQSFLQRFTPRKAKSVWSQINREHIARLIGDGRMKSHGLRQVEAAKADGRWQAAYAGAKRSSIPEDLQRAIAAEPKAEKTFATLDKVNLYALSYRLETLKTERGRKKKIESFVAMLARGETIHPLKAPTAAREQNKPASTNKQAGGKRSVYNASNRQKRA
jgi:uncharacterized protein YdeI (YjbR/CyaY-like superfamily)